MRKNAIHLLKFWLGTAAAAGLCLLLGTPQARALTCEVSPTQVPIDLFYHGTNLVVSGTSAPGRELIVKISAPLEDSALKYKGKAGGVFWMKMGDMEFRSVPNIYMVYTSGEIKRILSPGEQNHYLIGYSALKEQTKIESPGRQPDKEQWFTQFVKFKEQNRLYRIQEGAITRKHGQTSDEYRLEVAWPFQAPPGTYSVEVLAVQDGTVMDQAQASVEVERAGLVQQISGMAFNRPALYGIMALVIAMTAGFAVGSLFKGGGAH